MNFVFQVPFAMLRYYTYKKARGTFNVLRSCGVFGVTLTYE